jgi:transposase
MAKAYSDDLRRRILGAYDRELGNLRELAERFCVSYAYARKRSWQRRRTGQIERVEQRHGPPRGATAEVAARLRRLLREQPDRILCPRLQPGQVVVMDNLGAHKVQRVRELIEATGAQLLYLPPYSPDFNPTEQCWSKVKQRLRALKARTVDSLQQAISEAIATITPQDASACFRPCGYDLH